jgi:iron complex transport system substrate-binding protein
MRSAGLVLVFLLSALFAQPVSAQGVVSLNVCTDQMLVLLAPEKVAALSSLARDPALSFVAEAAQRLPVVRTSAEAVLRLSPDLVLGGAFGAQTTLAVLEREGLRVVRLDMPQDFDGIRRQTRALAALLGVLERGEALIAEMDARLAALPRPARRRSALVWQARGYTAGPGTLMDAVLREAGLANASDGRRVGLESLLRQPPDLLVTAVPSEYPSLATEPLGWAMLDRIPRKALPPALTVCAGPFTVRAAELLAE